jgi:predicted PurR-regulated permease PerM
LSVFIVPYLYPFFYSVSMTNESKQPTDKITQKELTYIEKVWHTVAIVALLVVVILIARVAFNVLLMVLAGILISIGGSFAILAVLFWIMGTKISNQVAVLSDTLPHTISNAKIKMAETPIGRKILEYLASDNSDALMTTAKSFFNTSFGVLGDIYIILFLAIFFTSNPDLYKDGLIKLVPDSKKPLARQIFDRISYALKGWLKGMMLSMVLVFILLSIGLGIMSIPVALVLALLTGLLKLIPNFGSLAAMIPGVLLALTISTNTAIIVALIYMVTQTIVSNIVTPIIQNRMINLPPALTILAQVLMGTLSGVLGIILAVPLLAIVMILVDELYVKKINETDTPVTP